MGEELGEGREGGGEWREHENQGEEEGGEGEKRKRDERAGEKYLLRVLFNTCRQNPL